MTDRLDKIRERLEGGIHYQHAGQWVREDIAYLLEEIERLNALLAEKQTDIVDRLESRLDAKLRDTMEQP